MVLIRSRKVQTTNRDVEWWQTNKAQFLVKTRETGHPLIIYIIYIRKAGNFSLDLEVNQPIGTGILMRQVNNIE